MQCLYVYINTIYPYLDQSVQVAQRLSVGRGSEVGSAALRTNHNKLLVHIAVTREIPP